MILYFALIAFIAMVFWFIICRKDQNRILSEIISRLDKIERIQNEDCIKKLKDIVKEDKKDEVTWKKKDDIVVKKWNDDTKNPDDLLYPDLYPKNPDPKLNSDPKVKSSSLGESLCRTYLEKRFGKKFPNVRPDWLRNPKTGYKLELDCYCEDLKLAVEYNGEQHYKMSRKFHRTIEDFEYQKYRDEVKEEICKDKGVFFVSVPFTVPPDRIDSFLENKLKPFVNQGSEDH